MLLKTLTVSALMLMFLNLTNISCEIRYVSHKNCNNARKGTIIANPGNCSQYIVCNGLRSTLGECPQGQYFNEDMLSCDKNPIQCREKIQPTTAVNSSLQEDKLKEKENENYKQNIAALTHECSSLQDHNIAQSLNCVYYYQCVRGVLSLKRCPFGLAWHWRNQRCVPKAKAVCYTHI
ncbi:uncharacterized protein LOC135955744 [Calliphora vicina]|uniref:uncharacterized protein LOC135955744 n=1 Tax=Calliphora vicina TaxID=7373 RepID=UPI00325A6ED8